MGGIAYPPYMFEDGIMPLNASDQTALKIAPIQPSRIANTNGRRRSPASGMRSNASRGRVRRSFTVPTSPVVHGTPGCSHGITGGVGGWVGGGGSVGGGGGGQSADIGNLLGSRNAPRIFGQVRRAGNPVVEPVRIH